MENRRGWIWRIGLFGMCAAAIAAMFYHDPAMVVLGLIGLAIGGAIFALMRGLRRWRGNHRNRQGTRVN
jgi:hypothetical protein